MNERIYGNKTLTMGGRIEYLRKMQKITQAELGNRIGLSASSIARIEKGITTPINPVVDAIALALGTSSDYLHMKTDDIKPDNVSITISHSDKELEKLRKPTVMQEISLPAYRLKGHFNSISGIGNCKSIDELQDIMHYDPNRDPEILRASGLQYEDESELYKEFDDSLKNLISYILELVDGEYVERKEVPTRIKMTQQFLEQNEEVLKKQFPGNIDKDSFEQISNTFLNIMINNS